MFDLLNSILLNFTIRATRTNKNLKLLPLCSFSRSLLPSNLISDAVLSFERSFGGSTYISKALEFTNRTVLREEEGNRPDVVDVVFTVTDGMAKDGDQLKDASSNLRRQVLLRLLAEKLVYS